MERYTSLGAAHCHFRVIGRHTNGAREFHLIQVRMRLDHPQQRLAESICPNAAHEYPRRLDPKAAASVIQTYFALGTTRASSR
jgi:hypothetical protein